MNLIAQALRQNRSLWFVDFASNLLTAKCIKELTEALKGESTINVLDLQGNGIGDEGAGLIAEWLATNTTITHLDLWGIEMTEKGARALANALRDNQKLTVLEIGQNSINTSGTNDLKDAMIDRATPMQLMSNNNILYDTYPLVMVSNSDDSTFQFPCNEEAYQRALLRLQEITQSYLSSITNTENRLFKAVNQLNLTLTSPEYAYAKDCIRAFYEKLDSNTERGTIRELIQNDKRIPAKEFLKGVGIIAAVVATGIVLGVFIMAVTGKTPLSYFKSYSERFISDVNKIDQSIKTELQEKAASNRNSIFSAKKAQRGGNPSSRLPPRLANPDWYSEAYNHFRPLLTMPY